MKFATFAWCLCQLFISYHCPGQFKNPVLDKDFPNPTVVRFNNTYYAYATEGNGQLIQVATSTDLQHWKMLGSALAEKPSWGNMHFWAPHVLFDKQLNKYVLFYSAESSDTTIGKCLGVAFADKPQGPFTDKGEPLICGDEFVNIDPMAMTDPVTGKKILYWGSGFKPIKVQEMCDDWKNFKPGTSAKELVWPGKENKYTNLVEGGWIDYQNGYYYLYYSGDNCCGASANYAVLVARSRNAMGPFSSKAEEEKSTSSAILEKDSIWNAPGHNSIVRDAKGKIYIVYHAFTADSFKTGSRLMCIREMHYKNGWPVIDK
jgi:arabinan endo-1,5-alpha-L-arabinosidase